MSRSPAPLPDPPATRFSDVPKLGVPERSTLRSGLEPFGSDRFEHLMQRIMVELTLPERRSTSSDGRSTCR